MTLPALVLTGMPALAANANGTVALLPAYIASTVGFRGDIEAPPGLSLLSMSLLSLVSVFLQSVTSALSFCQRQLIKMVAPTPLACEHLLTDPL